jgi:hypothetical protein
MESQDQSGLMVYTRGGGREVEQPFEKPVVVPVVSLNSDFSSPLLIRLIVLFLLILACEFGFNCHLLIAAN